MRRLATGLCALALAFAALACEREERRFQTLPAKSARAQPVRLTTLQPGQSLPSRSGHGPYDENAIRSLWDPGRSEGSEGYVVRVADRFGYGEFRRKVGKFVRREFSRLEVASRDVVVRRQHFAPRTQARRLRRHRRQLEDLLVILVCREPS